MPSCVARGADRRYALGTIVVSNIAHIAIKFTANAYFIFRAHLYIDMIDATTGVFITFFSGALARRISRLPSHRLTLTALESDVSEAGLNLLTRTDVRCPAIHLRLEPVDFRIVAIGVGRCGDLASTSQTLLSQ